MCFEFRLEGIEGGVIAGDIYLFIEGFCTSSNLTEVKKQNKTKPTNNLYTKAESNTQNNKHNTH